MKTYRVVITSEAKEDLKRYLAYIQHRLQNPQAAKNVAQDFRKTKDQLKTIAGSLAESESETLRSRNLKRLNFQQHDYFLLFRVNGNAAEVVSIFHSLEDYEKKLR